MGALPKNKITRSERGKRRRGNTPKLAKNTKHTSVPLHKRGLVAKMLRSVGLTASPSTNQPASQSTTK